MLEWFGRDCYGFRFDRFVVFGSLRLDKIWRMEEDRLVGEMMSLLDDPLHRRRASNNASKVLIWGGGQSIRGVKAGDSMKLKLLTAY